MTDSIKKLFDAPWTIEEEAPSAWYCVIDSKDSVVADVRDKKTVNRLARLPELYDALVETVYYKCFECMGGLRHNIDLTREELVKDGCPKQNKSNVCIYVKHLELLRKVRDVE